MPKNRPITDIWGKDFNWSGIDLKIKTGLWDYYQRISSTKTGLYLHGIAGSGKTTIAVNMGIEWNKMNHQYQAKAIDWIELLQAIKTFPENRSMEQFSMIYNLEHCHNKRLIIFDDFGAGRYTENAIEVTENIIRRLEKVGVICIFTSNVSPEKIIELYSDQVWSRICGMTVQIEMGGRDWRVR